MTEGSNGTKLGHWGRHNIVRRHNERAVLRAIYEHGPSNRAAIAAVTGLSKPTAGVLLEQLAQQGHLRVGSEIIEGRSREVFALADGIGLAAGVTIDASEIRVALTDLTGSRTLEPVVRSTPTGQRELIQAVRDALDEAHLRFGSQVRDLRTVTLAVPGGVTGKGSTIALASTVPALEELQVAEFLGIDEATIVRVENDANLAALGEGWRGAAAGSQDFAAIYLGVGVGMGIVSEGRLLRGAHGLAGEIAFLPIGADPAKGAAYTGGAFEVAVTATRAGKATAALAPLVAQAALSVQATLDPELIVIGGPQAQHPGLNAEVEAALSGITALKLNIVGSSLGEEAVLVGAVADARSNLLETVLG